MSNFLKPGGHKYTYEDLGLMAVERALFDSGINFEEIQQGYVGYVYLPSCAGQKILYNFGKTGIPIINVNNNCATGSSAFYLACNAIKSGQIDCAIVVGVDVMYSGPLKIESSESAPIYEHMFPLVERKQFDNSFPPVPQVFGNAGKEHMEKYGTTFDQISSISSKNYSHGKNNPYAQYRLNDVTCDTVKSSKMIYYPLTKLSCCPTSDGAACCILVSENFAKKKDKNFIERCVEVLACELGTDTQDSFENKSLIDGVGYRLAKRVAKQAYSKSKLTPEDIQVVELHDCFSANELITYEALGLCDEGKAGKFVDEKNNTYGGKYVVNPSGGLTSKGHPLGATGIAQITELCWQLRNLSGIRQVKNAKHGLSHNLGLGSAIVVTILKKYDEKNYEETKSIDPSEIETNIRKSNKNIRITWKNRVPKF